MRHYEDQEEVQTKEWEEALSVIDNIIKDYKEIGSSDKTVREVDPLALDVARWKVVWGKKPAQYRLKHFLMWSVDEMPSIPEECESFPENVDFVKEPVDTQKIRNDKKLRLMRKKIFRMNRRVDEINILLVHAAEEVEKHTVQQDGNGAGGLTEVTRAELIVERNFILDKLRNAKKKLILLKNAGVDQKKLALPCPDDSEGMLGADASGDSRIGLDLNLEQELDGDSLNFKHGRRAAIKKEVKSSIWTKVVNSPLKENSERRSESLNPEDKKCRKKKFCRKHHRKVHDKSNENEMLMGRRALSETDFTRVVKELNERDQEKLEITQNGQSGKIGKMTRIGEPGNGIVGIGGVISGKAIKVNGSKSCVQVCLTDLAKLQSSKKSGFGAAHAKSNQDNIGCSSPLPGSSGQIILPKTRKDKIPKVTPDGFGDTLDTKRSFEPGKLPKVRKCPPSTAKEMRSKPQMRSKPEEKELMSKVRSQKNAEAVVKNET